MAIHDPKLRFDYSLDNITSLVEATCTQKGAIAFVLHLIRIKAVCLKLYHGLQVAGLREMVGSADMVQERQAVSSLNVSEFYRKFTNGPSKTK